MRFFTPKERTIATIGYPGHGKSIFLAGLFWDSFFALSRSFQDGGQPYSVRALNEEAGKLFYGNAKMLHAGRSHPPTHAASLSLRFWNSREYPASTVNGGGASGLSFMMSQARSSMMTE